MACDAHRPDILVSVILGIGLLGLDLPSIRVMWRRGRDSNPPGTDRQSVALPRGLPRQISVRKELKEHVVYPGDRLHKGLYCHYFLELPPQIQVHTA